ncbi:MAG: hypothetical protein ACQEXV_22230 [Bacillota bacterium]
MSEEKEKYKYPIPRKVRARFELFGLDGPKTLMLLPFLGIAYVLFKLIDGAPAIVLPIVIAGLGYFMITQEIEGETPMELVENRLKDLFTQKLLLWEEENHARYYDEKTK